MPSRSLILAVQKRLIDETLIEELRLEGERILGRRFYRHRVLEILASYDYVVPRARGAICAEARDMAREDRAIFGDGK